MSALEDKVEPIEQLIACEIITKKARKPRARMFTDEEILERQRERMKQYYRENKDKVKGYYDKNRDKKNEKAKERYKNNKEQVLANAKKRRNEMKEVLRNAKVRNLEIIDMEERQAQFKIIEDELKEEDEGVPSGNNEEQTLTKEEELLVNSIINKIRLNLFKK